MPAHRLGVCSWSLRPESPAALAESVLACGLDSVQLALNPISTGAWDEAATREALAQAGISVLSGMMETTDEDYSSLEAIRLTGGLVPDRHWETNLDLARKNAALAQRWGLDLVTLHAGFIPHGSGDPDHAKIIDRLRQVVDVFAAAGVRVGLETGQESAATLIAALDAVEKPQLGVNFDPANMILYDMGDPVAALDALASRVLQIHIKDATRTSTPGTWGAEKPTGEGEVDWAAFFAVVNRHRLEVDLVIEREAGEQRIADIRAARALVQSQTEIAS
jgi:L-ribulose-5-phosphate 3-epimerase